jgi:hypothetical protein
VVNSAFYFMERQHGWFAGLPPTEKPGDESDASDEKGDGTEGPTAFANLSLIIKRPTLWVDVGSGASDKAAVYMEERFPFWLRFLSVDPYNRTPEHNAWVQTEVEARGGADMVSSMSVLNILESEALMMHHLRLLHRILKPGGQAVIKVWNGERHKPPGRTLPVRHTTVFQRNQPATFFAPYVHEVFGKYEILDEICIIAWK